MLKQTLRLVLLPAAAAVLVACGGGGGGGALGVSIQGVVATGAPLVNASVELYDATGSVITRATTDSEGNYKLTLPLDFKAPFVIKASKEDVVLFSPMSSTSVTRVNVTPLTNLVTAQLSPTGNPSALVQQIKDGAVVVDNAKVMLAVDEINRSIDPLLRAVASSGVDPISGVFKADGQGYDRALNALNISINQTESKSNIIITVKAAVANDVLLPEINFVSGSPPPVLPSSVENATLPPVNTDSLIAGFLSKLNNCYSLPSSERVLDDSTIKAQACKDIFYNNDPKTFKSNGSEPAKGKAWASLWNSSVKDIKFSNGNILFYGESGDMLLTWRAESSAGNVSYGRTIVRNKENVLQAYGNQYKYPFSVKPISEARNYLNSEHSYFSTGYDIQLPNIMDGEASIYNKVIVTSPDNRKVELFPQPALSFLTIKNENTQGATSIVRLAGGFWNSTLSAKKPRQINERLFWARSPNNNEDIDWTDSEIKAIPNIGQWKAEFFLNGNSTNRPDETQYSVVTTRPLTTSEISQRGFVKLTSEFRDEIISDSNLNGYITMENGTSADVSASNGGDAWSVPQGALPPSLLKLNGFFNRGNSSYRWDDGVNILTTARKATVTCTKQGSGDIHCSGTPSPSGSFSNEAKLDLVQIFAYDNNEMQWMSFFPLYKPKFK